MPERGEDILQQRLSKLERIRGRGIDPYPPRFHRTHTSEEALALFQRHEKERPGDPSPDDVAVAGRVTALRRMGKATFLDLRDGSGRIQTYLRKDRLGDDAYTLLDELDLGDFLGVRGRLFRTRAGEITIEAAAYAILTKALRPLPEKWHGLKDVEIRFRQRYLDLVANEEVRRIFRIRPAIVSAMRRYLEGQGFVEVETPTLLPVAAGANARPFMTHHNALDQDLYLRIATELHLKRLIVGGMERVFEIGRVFRNEGIDATHNPEFTTMECYQAYADYNDMMRLVEEMVSAIAQEVLGARQVKFGEHTIDVTPPWPRVPMRQAILERSGIDIEAFPDNISLSAEIARRGVTAVETTTSWGRMVDKLLSAFVEPTLVQPTFLIDYPVAMSPLAKRKPEDKRYVERFEGFVAGMEVANSFTELNDPVDQRARFEEQERLRREQGEEEAERLDEDFLVAIEHGMPPTGGLGMGVDRLVMLLTGQESIREVVLFPQLRTK
ncbi:MAG: lysine--tRNA ligase [Chloroflexi bacterium]|nr:lysine--tRNA ligase [Chloroflexota bacterium]